MVWAAVVVADWLSLKKGESNAGNNFYRTTVAVAVAVGVAVAVVVGVAVEVADGISLKKEG